MLRQIVGFEIVATKIEGKFKLSQNRTCEDQANVIASLEKAEDSTVSGVACMMKEQGWAKFRRRSQENEGATQSQLAQETERYRACAYWWGGRGIRRERYLGELRRLGATVIEIPFIEIRKPRQLQAAGFGIEKSGGVRLAHSYQRERSGGHVGADAAAGREQRKSQASADRGIGPATKKAIEKHGVKVDVVPKEYVAESVVRSLRRRVKGKRVLLVRAKVARDVIPRELRRAGARVDVVEAYETVVPQASRTRLQAVLRNPRRRPHVVTFTSSSTVRNFVELLGGARSARRAVQALPGRGVDTRAP